MRKLLEGLSKDDLIDFILEYAENDVRFVNSINVRFSEPKYEEELNKIRNKINYALADVSNYRTHDSWGNAIYDVSDIFEEICQRAEQGHIRLALSELEMLYRKLLENLEYQGECEISDDADYCVEIMSDIADKVLNSEDEEYIFGQCLELSELKDGKDYGVYHEDKLLSIAVKFVTQENRKRLENAIARYSSPRREKEFRLILVELARRCGSKNVDIAGVL